MPYIHDESPSDASDHNNITSYPQQTMSSTPPGQLYQWPDLQHSMLDSRVNLGFRSMPEITSHPMPSYQISERQEHTPQETWENHSYLPFLPRQSGSSLWRPWTDPNIGDNMSETSSASRSHSPHSFTFGAADPTATSLYPNTSHLHTAVPGSAGMYPSIEGNETMDSYDTDIEDAKSEPPYAKLIYQALMDAPEHKLVLKDIYAWISENTDKAKDPAFKGWQNSVRHNLSMNGAFRKVPFVDPENKHKKGFIWVLEPYAVGNGIESTTRYRQKTPNRRGDWSDPVDPKRQRSGRKGGRAAKKAARMRRSAKLDDHDSQHAHYFDSGATDYSFSSSPTASHRPLSPELNLYSMGGLPYYVDTPTSQSPQPEDPPFNYGDVTSNATLPINQEMFNPFGNEDLSGSHPEDIMYGTHNRIFTAFP